MKYRYVFLALLSGIATLLLTACTEDLDALVQTSLESRALDFTVNIENNSAVYRTRFALSEPVHFDYPDIDDSLGVHLTVDVQPFVEDNKGMLAALKAETRGKLIDTDNLQENYNAIGLFVTTYDATTARTGADSNLTPNFMDYNEKATLRNGIYKPTSGVYEWPDENTNLKVECYAPHSSEATAATYTFTAQTAKGRRRITYVASTEASEQVDLLVGTGYIEGTEASREGAWPVELKHALAAIKVKIGEGFPDGIIKSVSLKNVYKGMYIDFPYKNPSNGNMVVTTPGTSGGYADIVMKQTVSINTASMKNQLIVSGDNTWLVPAQSLSSNATYPSLLEIEFQPDGKSEAKAYAFKLYNAGGVTRWNMGQTYTYTLSTVTDDEYVITVEAPSDYNAQGGTGAIKVTSYKNSNSVTTGDLISQTPISWSVVGYSTDGTSFTSSAPTSVTLAATSGSGSVSASDVNATLGKANYTYNSSPKSTTLTNATYISSRRDLSLYDVMGNANTGNQRCTANCYVVRAPGLYMIPCVYGNAIKNGTTNSNAYTSSGSGDTFLTPFINANGTAITDPWLQNCGATPASAEIVWQDAENLIRSSSVSIADVSGKKYLYFAIAKDDIQLGNAVLAVKDASGNIQWSWHIWVTDENFTSNSKPINSGNLKNSTPATQDYTLMGVPIGYAKGTVTADYTARDFWVKIRQTDSNKEAIVKLHQNGATGMSTLYEGAPYYQYGRKDPFPMRDVDGYTGSPRTSSINWSTFQTEYNRDIAKLKDGILHPGTLYGGSGSFGSSYWHDANYSNLWDANGAYISGVYPLHNKAVVKTIYDPSPAGWHVPECGAFGRWNQVTTITYSSSDNTYSLTNNGTTYVIPVLGSRSGSDGTIVNHGVYAPYWTAACESQNARNFNLVPTNTGYTAYITAYVISSGAMDYTVEIVGQANGYGYAHAAGLPIMPVKDY